MLKSPIPLARISENIKTGNTYEGKYICQKGDIDLSDIKEYTGLDEKFTFAGTYNGCGNKIKVNL